MGENQRRVQVTVTGRVQGVFFRARTADLAQDLGLAGHVRNLPGGQVEAVFQGPADAVDQAVAFCHTGPPQARVDHVQLTELDVRPDGSTTFEVR